MKQSVSLDGECECATWAFTGHPPVTSHHRNCPQYDPDGSAVRLVSALVAGIEAWANDEDGVHPEAWDAYCAALVFIGRFDKLNTKIAP